MQELTAEQAVLFLKSYLGALKNESRITKSILAAVPAEKGEYRPDPASKSAMELVRHIANADNRFVEAVITGVFNPVPGLPDTAKTPAEIASWYEERHAKNFEALDSGDSRTAPEDGGFPRDDAAARGHIPHDGVAPHHSSPGTAIVGHLRCMGAKVPAIYGESYDSAQAKRAAEV